MQIMPSRQKEIEKAIDGLNATHVPLISMDSSGYHAAGHSDNDGIYYFVSHIAKYFNLSATTATDVFLLFLLALGASIAICCFFFLFKSWLSRIVSSSAWLFLTVCCACFWSDVYIASFLAISAIVPLFVLIKNRPPKSRWVWIGALAFSGIVIGYSNFIRQYAGTTALLFLVLWITLDQALKKKERALYLCLLFVFSCIPHAQEKSLSNQRDVFLGQHQASSDFKAIPFPTWHLFYIGLGFLENDYGIERTDSSGFLKAQSINPEVQYLSAEYNEILKHEYFALLKSDPWFVIKTYLMKSLIICWMLLKYTNLGLVFCFYVRPSWREVWPFFAAASFGALSGIAAEPSVTYILGSISLGTFFGVYMMGSGIEKYLKVSRAIAQHQKI